MPPPSELISAQFTAAPGVAESAVNVIGISTLPPAANGPPVKVAVVPLSVHAASSTFTVTDFLPAGFSLNDAAWTDNGTTATFTGGPLAAGGSVDIPITLTADSATPGAAVNWAEISSDGGGTDVDSTPDDVQGNDAQPAGPNTPGDNVIDNSGGDEDDHDPAGVSVATFDLALQKFYTSDTFGAPTDGVIQAGSDVTFTITVTNQGTLDAGTFEVTDFLPAGFVLNDPAWTCLLYTSPSPRD